MVKKIIKNFKCECTDINDMFEHVTQYRKYNDKYDSYYCSKCMTWTEKKCGDPECNYCTKRPERPNDNEDD